MHLDLRISLRIFEKIQNDPHVIFRGLKEMIHEKKPEAKNLVIRLSPLRGSLFQYSIYFYIINKGYDYFTIRVISLDTVPLADLR